jgi:hypothetical protein
MTYVVFLGALALGASRLSVRMEKIGFHWTDFH